MSWSPTTAPRGTDATVLDSFGAIGTAYRETDIERADFEIVIADLISGEFNDPVRVVACRPNPAVVAAVGLMRLANR
jgi:hypothetical protein